MNKSNSSLHTGFNQTVGVIISKEVREAKMIAKGYRFERTSLGIIVHPPVKITNQI